MKIIPAISNAKANILTTENWQSVNVDIIALNLEDLLYKPGSNYLVKNYNIKKYFGLQGTIVLNLLSLNFKDDICSLKSPYDGSKFNVKRDEIIRLIIKMHPDILILSNDFSSNDFYTTNVSIIHADEIKIRKCSINNVAYEIIELPSINAMISNLAIDLGVAGKIIINDEVTSIDDTGFQQDYSLLDDNCNCPTCEHKLTKAYYNHLYQAVPFLCIRYLIIHNVYNLNQKKIFT